MILALILLGVQVWGRGRGDDDSLSGENGFFKLEYGDEYGSLNIYKADAWHSAYIVPDNNYAPLSEDLFIYFSVEEDIAGSYAEFSHPDADDYSNCTLTALEGSDWKATCDISDLDTEGTYGPISLVIRSSEDNQIIAEDVAFGYFALLGDEPDEGVLAISFYSTEDSPAYVVQEEDIVLQFDVTIDVEMYSGDYFVLIIDPAFTYDDLELEWFTDVEGNEFFNETMTNYFVDDEGDFYIYGHDSDLTESVTISFIVSGFQAPFVQTAADAYEFSLEVHRFGTNTIYKTYTGAGPSDSVDAGDIEIVSWAPVNSAISAATDLHDGLTTWFKLTVKTDHDLPEDGYIEFVFTGNEIDAKTYESDADQLIQDALEDIVYTTNSGLSCDITSSTEMTCTASSAIAAGTNIVVYNLISIANDLVIASVKSFDKDDDTIDENTVGLTVTLPVTGKELAVEYARIATSLSDDTGVNAIMSSSVNYGILVGFKLSELFTFGSDTFNVYLPFTTGTAADSTKLVIKSTASVKKTTTDAAIDYDEDSTLFAASDVDQVLGTNSITVVLGTSGTLASGKYFYAFIGSKTLGTDSIYLPKIPTQMAQMAEIVLKVKIGTNYYTYASPLYFSDTTLSVTPTLKLACKNPIHAGIPATLSYTPVAYTAPTGYTLKVLLGITNANLFTGTNLVADEIYPGTTDLKVTSAGKLYKSGLSSLTATATSITIPLPALTSATTLTLAVKVYLVPSSGDDILLYSGDSTSVTTTVTLGTAFLDLPADLNKNVGVSYDLPVTIASGYTDGDNTASETISVFYILLFPYGYATADTGLTLLTLSNSLFPYFYGYKTLDNYAEATGITAGNTIAITVPWFEAATTIYLFSEVGSLSAFTNIDCDIADVTITTQSAGSLTFSSYSPPTAKAYTYNNEDVDVTLTLTSGRKILKGTVFTATIDYWTGCTAAYTIGSTVGNTATVDYVSGTTITVKLTGCTLPEIASGEDSVTENGFASVSGEYNDNEYLYWTDSGTQTQTVISSNTPVSGKVSGAKLWVFPNVNGAESVYFGISFTLDSTIPLIPAESTITIDGDFDDDEDLEDNLWTNFAYESVSISAGVLTITISEQIASKSYLMIVKDLAFDLTTITPSTVLVTVSAGDVDIIADVSTTQKYTVDAEPEGTFEFAIEVSESSAGFETEYNFTLTFDSAAEEETFWVHLDATGYNNIAGPAFYFEDLPGILFLYAADDEGVFVPCITNHWVTSCGFDGPIEADGVLSFSVWIKNSDETGSWGVFVTDDNLNYLYQAAYTTSDLTFTNEISNDIDLYFADADFSGSDDHYEHNLELFAFVDVEATAGSMFTVVFPAPYDFSLYPEDTIVCSLGHNSEDESGVETSVTVLDGVDCMVMDNSVVFTLEEDLTLTSDHWTFFSILNVLTPELMFEGREEDFELNPNENEYYSENFCILYSTEEDGIVSASYDNLNAAFAGFTASDLEALEVNGGNNLQVTPGTYSGPYQIKNKVGKFNAESVDVTWTAEEDFIQLDEETYYLDFVESVAYFWIGVPSDNDGEYIEEGKYVISWEIDETPLPGLDAYYGRPRNTIVEISYELTFKVKLSPPDVFVPTSGWSMPLNLQFDLGEQRDFSSFPYGSIDVTFGDNETLGLSFRPNPIKLDMDKSDGFVSIKCTECIEGLIYEFEVSIEGDSESAFEMEKDSYGFTSGSRYDTPATFSIVVEDIKATEFTLRILSDQVGVATWTVVSEDSYDEDSNITSYEYITANSYILGAATNSEDDLETRKEDHAAKLKELDDMYDDFTELTKKKLSLQRKVDYTAQSMVIEEGATTLLAQLSGLAPKTTYFIYLFFDNFDGTEVVLANETIKTARTPSHASLSFEFTTDIPDADELKSILKSIFGLADAYINTADFAPDRRLADSSTVVVYSDTSSSTSSYSTAEDSETDINESSGGTVTITEIADEDTEVAFEGTSTWSTDNGIYVALNYSSSVDGYLYCTVEGNGTVLTSDEVYEAVNADGTSVDQISDVIAAGKNYIEINFTEEEFTTLGTYYVNCIVCNDFPGTPDCSDDVQSTEYEYTGEEDNSSSSGAEALVVAFAAYFLF